MGREMPLMRPMTSVAAAKHAPVEPAEKKPWAWPSLTRRQPTTMELSFFLRTACAGWLGHLDDLGGNLRTAACVLRSERLDHVGGTAKHHGKPLVGGKRRRHALEHDLGSVVAAHGIHCDGDVVCHVDTLSLAGVARRAGGAAKRKKASLRQWRRREASSCNCTL